MTVPPPPPKPPEPPKETPQSSVLAVLTVMLLLGAGMVVAGFTCGPLMVLLLAIPILAMLHYLLWGWWMGKMVDTDERDEKD